MGRKTVFNRITSPEKTAQINKNNMQLKDDFLDYLKSVQRSPGTISGYNNDLLIVFTYMLDNLNNKDFQKLTKRDIIRMQNWMLSNGNSSARVRRIKAAISSLSNYCENILADDDPEFEGYRSIVRKIENPPMQAVREKTVLSDDDVDKILDVLVEKKLYQHACFIALGAFGGRRKAEIVRFKMSDFDDSMLVCEGALYKSSPILTKGGKYLECYTLAKKFKPYFDLWVEERKRLGIESIWVFPSRSNPEEHINGDATNGWTDTASRLTGYCIYPHALRHHYTSRLARANIPDNVIVKIIGWASADMFNIYNDNSKDDEIAKFFKGGDICVNQSASLSDL